jgi:SAM-dependent methyltransferase
MGKAEVGGGGSDGLPPVYPFVAADILAHCWPVQGLWIDLGCGDGGVGLELARACSGTGSLIDPDEKVLRPATERVRQEGLGERVGAVVGRAEALPIRDNTAMLVVSRGSIFFWGDPPTALREVRRALSPCGQAMIGGGLGSGYPLWAREEFTRRRHASVRSQGPEAWEEFERVRDPETFPCWAREAGLTDYSVVGEGAREPDSDDAGVGIWLRFTSDEEDAG